MLHFSASLTLSKAVKSSLNMQYFRFLNGAQVVCSDEKEHHYRVENRVSDIPRLMLPYREQVTNREYEPWEREHLILDTALLSAEECADKILEIRNKTALNRL
jgi:hypothetical protein